MTTGLTYTEVQHHMEKLKLTQAQTVLDRLSEEATKGEWRPSGWATRSTSSAYQS